MGVLHTEVAPQQVLVMEPEVKALLWRFSTTWYDSVRHGSLWHRTERLGSGRFAVPLQFSTALEWAGLFTCCYSCAASTAVTSSLTRHKQTHNKGAYRRNGVLNSWHVDVFNSNGKAYENAWHVPPAAETVVAVPQAVEEEGRDVRGGVLRYLNS